MKLQKHPVQAKETRLRDADNREEGAELVLGGVTQNLWLWEPET